MEHSWHFGPKTLVLMVVSMVRRLSAVFAADVVGLSRMMETDEAGWENEADDN